MNMRTGWKCVLLASFVLALAPHGAFADSLVTVTSFQNDQILSVDLTTNTVTTLFSPSSGPDSLIFNGPNEIIYTLVNAGQLDMFNISTNANIEVAPPLVET